MRTCDDLGICQDRPIRCHGCMPPVRESQERPNDGAVLDALSRLLRPPRPFNAPEPRIGCGHARRYREESRKPEPSSRVALRQPDPDETPLSFAERRVAFVMSYRGEL